MNDYLQTILPEENAEWTGVIAMTMTCEDGYDFPLNTPEGGVFKCFADKEFWIPHFIPDCISRFICYNQRSLYLNESLR